MQNFTDRLHQTLTEVGCGLNLIENYSLYVADYIVYIHSEPLLTLVRPSTSPFVLPWYHGIVISSSVLELPGVCLLSLRKLTFQGPQPFSQGILTRGTEAIALLFGNNLHAMCFAAR